MNLAIATDFSGESTDTAEIKATLAKIKNAGFTHVHWCHEWDGDYLYSRYEMEQVREWFLELGLLAKSFHASKGSLRRSSLYWEHSLRKDYMSPDEYNRKAGVELIRNRIQFASMLGATEIVLHMNLPYMTFCKEPESESHFYRQVFSSLDELQEDALNLGIRICIENLLETPAAEQYRQFDRLFERYESSTLGLCLDTGHANIMLNQNCADFAKRYQDRLFAVHINDNLGGPADGVEGCESLACRCDLHMIPGQGTIDWNSLTRILADSPYELPLVLELCCRDADEQQWLQRAYEAGIRLTKQILL